MKLHDETGKLYYIGGCVRDEILGVKSLDIDICYEGDAVDYVKSRDFEIIKIQKDIRTAQVLLNGEEIDFASTRKEIYPNAGHLPVTTEIGCNLSDDLMRRDFTVNSIAKSVSTGEIFDPTGGVQDLQNKVLRIHHKESFKDDPTRIIRGLKFRLRFGFDLESETAKLQDEYLKNVNYDMSFSRLKKELIDTFNLNKFESLNKFIDEKIYKLVTPNLHQALPQKNIETLINKFQIQNPWIIYLGWLDLSNLELTREEQKVLNDYSRLKTVNTKDDYEVYTNCAKSDIRAIILWIMMGETAGEHYLRKLKNIKIETTGDDLINLGFKGRQVGEGLETLLRAKLANPQMSKEEELKIIQN